MWTQAEPATGLHLLPESAGFATLQYNAALFSGTKNGVHQGAPLMSGYKSN
jgi:hypothetical protein